MQRIFVECFSVKLPFKLAVNILTSLSTSSFPAYDKADGVKIYALGV
jgi:hypothetical protein